MPGLRYDDSIQATVWRGYTNNGPFDLKKLQQNDFQLGSKRTRNRVNFVLPTVVGIRDGVPWGQDQLDNVMQRRGLNPYPTAKSPFLSNNIEDIAPRTYGVNPLAGTAGELTNLSSLGGTPLAIALDDSTALEQRVHQENMRTDPRNPLSAEFAWRAYMQQQNHPEKGPLADAQRTQMGDDEEDDTVIQSRIAKGYTKMQRLNNEDHNKVAEVLNNNREVTSQDILDLKDLFKANFLPTEQNNLNFINNVESYFRDHIKHQSHTNYTSVNPEGVQTSLSNTHTPQNVLDDNPFLDRIQINNYHHNHPNNDDFLSYNDIFPNEEPPVGGVNIMALEDALKGYTPNSDMRSSTSSSKRRRKNKNKTTPGPDTLDNFRRIINSSPSPSHISPTPTNRLLFSPPISPSPQIQRIENNLRNQVLMEGMTTRSKTKTPRK